MYKKFNEKGVLKMSNSLYTKENLKNLHQLQDLVPEQSKAFSEFSTAAFKEGALSEKEKEIIAVAVAHATQCPYCIDKHTKNAKHLGASLQELMEAAYVTSAVEAGGAITHSTNMHNALTDNADNALYERSNLKNLAQLGKEAAAFKNYVHFSNTALKEGALSAKFKEIIAVAVAHATLCPYCIDVHTKNAVKKGATNEELAEGVLIASALLAGGSYTHMANMIASYNE